jgi:hypothetical protein
LAFRSVKGKNRAWGVNPLRLEPDLNAARAIGLERAGMKRARTDNTAVTAKQKPIPAAHPTNSISWSMKWPKSCRQDAE